MAVTLNKANLVLKDANGNIGKIEQLSNRDLAKIKTAMSDVALVVNQSNHKPIAATTTNKGVVQLATSADVVAGASDKVITAEQLHNATTGTNLARSVNGIKPDANGNIAITSVANATKATNANNATNLGGYPASDYIRSANLNTIRKNDGNDYYDDSDITSLIYAGNGEGTIRNEIANGNFSRVHPGQTIVGRVTGTTYIVVGCNIYICRGDIEPAQNHIGLMPIQLVGNAGNLLWSGKNYQGASTNNTVQGYAPWSSDNNTEGKNQTSCYKDSYIANTVLLKVYNLWLKPDFEDQGISVLTFRSLDAISFDTNATCMSNPNLRGCATNAGWSSRRLVLPSELEIYGHYHWSGSPWESGSQHIQLPLYRHKEIHKVYPRVDIWLKDSASASHACYVNANGVAHNGGASRALRVCPLFLIA